MVWKLRNLIGGPMRICLAWWLLVSVLVLGWCIFTAIFIWKYTSISQRHCFCRSRQIVSRLLLLSFPSIIRVKVGFGVDFPRSGFWLFRTGCVILSERIICVVKMPRYWTFFFLPSSTVWILNLVLQRWRPDWNLFRHVSVERTDMVYGGPIQTCNI